MEDYDENIALPEPGVQTPDDHMDISKMFVGHARIELAKGNRLQASEKVWGAAAHALASVATQRGWHHDGHYELMQIAIQLSNEFDRPDLENNARIAETFHVNFYTNMNHADSIGRAIEMVERFVGDLDGLRSLTPRPFRVKTNSDRNRLQHLLGRRVEADEASQDGFVNHDRLERLRRRRERQEGQQGEA